MTYKRRLESAYRSHGHFGPLPLVAVESVERERVKKDSNER